MGHFADYKETRRRKFWDSDRLHTITEDKKSASAKNVFNQPPYYLQNKKKGADNNDGR